MNWIQLNNLTQLEEIKENQNDEISLIFKHSTRCSISSMALSRLERSWKDTKIKTYLLDLIANRDISNEIQNKFGVYHESPQVIIIKNGKAIYDASHMAISSNDIMQKAV